MTYQAAVTTQIKAVRAQLRKVPAHCRLARYQIAVRKASDATMYLKRGLLEHAEACAFDAEYHGKAALASA